VGLIKLVYTDKGCRRAIENFYNYSLMDESTPSDPIGLSKHPSTTFWEGPNRLSTSCISIAIPHLHQLLIEWREGWRYLFLREIRCVGVLSRVLPLRDLLLRLTGNTFFFYSICKSFRYYFCHVYPKYIKSSQKKLSM